MQCLAGERKTIDLNRAGGNPHPSNPSAAIKTFQPTAPKEPRTGKPALAEFPADVHTSNFQR
jgi:hypothetical protein